VRWGATGKSVLATRAVAAGTTLWRESPVAAMQDISSQRHGAMACRHSLRCVGTMPEQLSVLGRFTEVEQAAGAATIAPELAELMGRAQASARLSGGFVQLGNELFSDAAARDQASVAYNSWLNADPAACASFLATPWTTARRGFKHLARLAGAAFQEHASTSNEIFLLAAQLLARYFVGNRPGAETAATVVVPRPPAEVLDGLISELWWALPCGAAAESEGDGDGETPEQVAAMRRELLGDSFELLRPVAEAAGARLTLEMYARLLGERPRRPSTAINSCLH
jgi:hypothetical protein